MQRTGNFQRHILPSVANLTHCPGPRVSTIIRAHTLVAKHQLQKFVTSHASNQIMYAAENVFSNIPAISNVLDRIASMLCNLGCPYFLPNHRFADKKSWPMRFYQQNHDVTMQLVKTSSYQSNDDTDTIPCLNLRRSIV